MSNELNANEQTNSILYSFNAKPGQEQEYFVKYKVSPRQGATPDMINDTVKHFKLAIRTLVAGVTNVSDNIPDRPQWAEPITHAEPRVVIYSFGGFNVPVSEGLLERVDINVFNEFSTASDCVAHMWMAIRAMADGEHKDDLLSSNGHVTKSQKPQSALVEHFGERKQSPSPAAPVNGSTPPPVPGQSPYIGAYNYKDKSEYIETLGGKTAKFDIMKMERIYDSRDASPLVQVYSSYNNGVSQYPSHDLKIKPKQLEKMDDYTRAVIQKILDAPQGENPIDTTQYVGTFFMFSPEDGKLYPLLNKLELAQQSTPPDRPEEQQADVPEEHPGDEIPF